MGVGPAGDLALNLGAPALVAQRTEPGVAAAAAVVVGDQPAVDPELGPPGIPYAPAVAVAEGGQPGVLLAAGCTLAAAVRGVAEFVAPD